jgi:hypothetical protein
VTAQTVSGINVLDVGNVRIADDPNGRYIQAVNTLIIRSTNNASALLVSSVTTNSWDASQLIRIRPQSGNGGIQFSTTSTSSPSNSIMTFLRQRNDGAKLAIINSEDFAASGQLPVNLFIHAGRETVSNNQANLILCHDGTSSRGNLLINTTTDAGFRLDVNGTARVRGTGTTAATSSFTVINSASTQLLNVRDDGITQLTTLIPDRILFNGGTQSISVNGTGNVTNFYGNSGAIGQRIVSQTGQSIHIAPSTTGGQTLVIEGVSVVTSINSSSILQVNSTTQGFLPPRMTTTQKNAIASPAAGLMVYDTTLNVISYFNGTSWI